MKTSSHLITVLSLLMLAGPSVAQTLSPPATEVAPSSNNSAVVSDGISIYRGQAYLLRNGRAAVINRALVPEGHFLTWEGRLAALPSGFSVYDNITSERDGFMVFHGQTFWLHGGKAALLNSKVVPEGQVLTPGGQLMPLPSDFSGFVRDRTPAGSTEPLTTALGTQALPNQAGVPQIHQGTDLRPSALPAGVNGAAVRGNAGEAGAVSGTGGVNSSGFVSNEGGVITNANNVVVTGGGRPNGVQGNVSTNVGTAAVLPAPTASTGGGVPATTGGTQVGSPSRGSAAPTARTNAGRTAPATGTAGSINGGTGTGGSGAAGGR